MNKILVIIRNILMFLLVLLNIKYISSYGLTGISFLLYLVFLIVLLIISIKDQIKKNMINENKTYNYLFIFVELIIIMIYLRTLYDPNLLYNSKYYMNLAKDSLTSNTFGSNITDIQYINLLYLYQNVYYFILMIILLYIYRKINMPKQKSKYNIITIICLILSITSIFPSLQCIYGTIENIIIYIMLNLILIGAEIYRLIKDNHKKLEWPIYLSFLFNAFAFICIIVGIII